jgi:3-hydroxybutyryl-CoA dehydratase
VSETKTPEGGYILEELSIGMSAEIAVEITHERIMSFAEASGDYNPIHIDEDYAKTTAYRGRVAHGLLSASFVSAVVGTMLPGPGAIYLDQTVSFHKPVRIGDTVIARVTVTAIDPASARVTLRTECLIDGEAILDGEATIRVPRRRKRG